MAKNILIFFPHRLKQNFGGPYSYLYQLKKAFAFNDVHLTFLSDLILFPEEVTQSSPAPSLLKKLLKPLLPAKAISSTRIHRYLKKVWNVPFSDELKSIDYNTFDAIHFHETVDIWRFEKLMENYKGTIILTSHSPKPYHLELLEDVFYLKKSSIWQLVYQQLERIDKIAFTKANVIVAPCKEALESYEYHWQPFKPTTQNKPFYFSPSGIEQPSVTKSPKIIREELTIADNAFVICYNGRHNKVKGYDLLLKAAKKLLQQYNDVYFLITGKKDEPSAIEHDRWIQTGWTTEPQNFVNASDVVVVPNRETFFDLNVLMALSLGKPVALSDTGGNKFFQKFASVGIYLFDIKKEDALIKALEDAYAKKEWLPAMGNANKDLFLQHFTLSSFAQQYHRFYISV